MASSGSHKVASVLFIQVCLSNMGGTADGFNVVDDVADDRNLFF